MLWHFPRGGAPGLPQRAQVLSRLREWTRVHHGGHTSSESGAPAPPARYTQRTSAPALLLLDERRFDPPRPVEVEHDGAWWPETQRAWRLSDDDRERRADVAYVVEYRVSCRTG